MFSSSKPSTSAIEGPASSVAPSVGVVVHQKKNSSSQLDMSAPGQIRAVKEQPTSQDVRRSILFEEYSVNLGSLETGDVTFIV